ncbi:hypothetical protein L345_17317, partial [Ophiophagus hannah]
ALSNIKHHFIFPILWLNETAIISHEKADIFRSKVNNKIKLLNFLQLALMIIGSSLSGFPVPPPQFPEKILNHLESMPKASSSELNSQFSCVTKLHCLPVQPSVMNPEEVMKNGSAPILKQKGPYTYRMRYKPKVNITEHDDATVSYFLENVISFEPNMSRGLESDNITTVNLAVVSAPVLYPDAALLLNMLIQRSNSTFLQTRTVNEILWGYEDPFLKLIPLPNIDNVVGIFYPFIKTFDGPYRIYSGKDDINKVGIMQSYKNNRTVDYWESYCGMVNG